MSDLGGNRRVGHPGYPVVLALALVAVGCPGPDPDDDTTGPPGDDDTSEAGDDDSTMGDDDSGAGDDDTTAGGPPISAVEVQVHPEVVTLLEVTWVQDQQVDGTWLEFSVDGGPWERSPDADGAIGPHREVVLGAPGDTEVTLRVVNRVGEQELVGENHSGSTGSLPAGMPVPTSQAWDPVIGSPARWMLGSVDSNDSEFGYYQGPFWLYVVDREGGVVWYHEVDPHVSVFPRVALDGSHLVYEVATFWSLFDAGAGSVIRRRTLDGGFTEERPVPGLSYAWLETADGGVLFGHVAGSMPSWTYSVRELAPDGSSHEVWNCSQWLPAVLPGGGNEWSCFLNALNWGTTEDSLVCSMVNATAVVEVDRASGDVLRRWGELEGAWGYDPPEAGFDWQHQPHFTPAGTLLVSTHVPGAQAHVVREYEVDDASQTLISIWSFGEGSGFYPRYAGEAVRLDNGNTLVNLGTDGVVLEVTPDGSVAWDLRWSSTFLLGHTTLIDDLYALNRGP